MNIVSRRDPFERPSLSRALNQLLSDPFFGDSSNLMGIVEEGTLPLDVSEDDRSVIVRASLPGFRKEDVSVEVHEGVLTIKAEHTEEKEEKNETFYRRERRFGSVSRRVALPSTVLDGETKAELKDGVLTLRIPKSPKAMPRKVSIQ